MPLDSKLALALVTGALALTGLAACGDSDETTAAEDSRDEYVAQVDQICADTTAEIDAQSQEAVGGGTPNAKDLERVVSEVTVPLLRQQYEEIAQVEPPAGSEEEVDAILAEADATLDAVAKDPASMLVIIGEPTPFDELGRLQVEFGLTMCGGVEEEA